MGVIELSGIFRAKNKTAAQWASENPILRDGELGHEKDTRKSKVGDGVTAWNNLKYANDIQLGTNILNGSHADWVAANTGSSGYETGELLYLDHTFIRGKQITYRVELKGEGAQAPQLGFEIKVHFTDNTDQWLARYTTPDIPDRGTFEKAYTFSSQVQDKEIEYARLYPVFRTLSGGAASGKLYVRHEFVGVGNTLPSTWSPSVADLQAQSSGGGEIANTIMGERITEGLEYMVPDSEEYENSEASELEIKPFTANEYSSQVPDEGALRGFGFLGKISNNAYSLALLVALEDGGTPKLYLGEIDNQGGGSNWTKVLVDNSNSPIPGYTKICSEWTGNLADVTQSMINFNREIPKNAKLLIEATIQGGPGPTSTIYATIPLVFAAINSTGQGVLFEYSAVSFSTGNASVGGVKLISMSAIMGAYGVQGLNVMIQPYNLSSSLQGAMLYIKGIYVKL